MPAAVLKCFAHGSSARRLMPKVGGWRGKNGGVAAMVRMCNIVERIWARGRHAKRKQRGSWCVVGIEMTWPSIEEVEAASDVGRPMA